MYEDDTVIQVRNLTKYYGEYMAIENVSFSVKKGEIVGFLGQNGAGKTTTMRILTGFMPATGGTATIAGYDIFSNSLDARRHIGYLPETVPLYSDMSVRGYLDYMGEIRGMSRNDRRRRIDDVIDLCRIGPRAEFLIQKLSKGFRQRVGLAQALLHEPDVLILDEPTVGLDPEERLAIRNVIKDVGSERTVMLSSHMLEEVSATCDRIIIINEGRIAAADTTENLTKRLEKAVTIQMQIRGPESDIAETLGKVDGVQNVTHETGNGSSSFTVEVQRGSEARDKLADAVVRRGWGLLELRQLDLSLEDIFLRVTSGGQKDEARRVPSQSS